MLIPVPQQLLARGAAVLLAVACSVGPQSPTAIAAQRGAEDAYQMQTFDSRPCAKRSPLGSCLELGSAGAPAAGVAMEQPRVAQPLESEPESDLIRQLKARSAENAEANALAVKQRTLANGLGGAFGPFSSDAPVFKADGDMEVISIAKLEQFKDKGYVVKNVNGLDAYAPGFDPVAYAKAEAERAAKRGGGFFGLF